MTKSYKNIYHPRRAYSLQLLAHREGYPSVWINIFSTNDPEWYPAMLRSQLYWEYRRGIPCRVRIFKEVTSDNSNPDEGASAQL